MFKILASILSYLLPPRDVVPWNPRQTEHMIKWSQLFSIQKNRVILQGIPSF